MRKVIFLSTLFVLMCMIAGAQTIAGPGSGLNRPAAAPTTLALGGTVTGPTALDYTTSTTANFLIKKATANYFFVGNDGKIGIGTITPTSLFSLGSAVANSKLAVWDNGTIRSGLGWQAGQLRLHLSATTDKFSFLSTEAAATDIMTIMGTGNVGIGIATPANKLSIAGGTATNFGLQFPGLTNATATTINTNKVLTLDAGGNVIWSNASTNFANGITGILPFANGGTGLSVLGTANQQLRINAAGTALEYFTPPVSGSSQWTAGTLATDITNANTGNVGIGTAAPADKLEVVGSATFGGGIYKGTLETFGTYFRIKANANADRLSFLSTKAGSGIQFSPNNAARGFLMTATGELLFMGGSGETLSGIGNVNGTGNLALLYSTAGNLQTEGMRLTTTGNVGIGTTIPAYKLDVNGDTKLGGAAFINNDLSVLGSSIQLGSTTQTGQVFIGLKQSVNAGTLGKGWNLGYTSSTNNDLYTYGYENAAYRLFTNTAERLTVTGAGNVGIGTATPGSLLEVAGSNSPTAFVKTTGTVQAQMLVGDASNGFGLQYYPAGNCCWPTGTSVLAGSGNGNLMLHTVNMLLFYAGGAERARFSATGNFGLGNSSPTEKLDITGNVKFSGALMPNNTAGVTGQVLTSAGPGLAPTWGAAGGGSSQWTTSSPNIYFNTGNVGIGTATPAAQLHVVGNITSPGTAINSEKFGLGALADLTYASAFGYNAHAKNGVAVGANANAVGDYTNAIGLSANANGFGSIAIGHGTNVTAAAGYGTAIGFGSTSSHPASIVIGVNTTSSDANQLVLGGDIREMIVGMNPQSTLAGVYGGVKIRTTDGLGTDNGGASMKLSAGRGTGAASGGFMSFSTTPSGTAGSVLNAEVERMRITPEGNVGIGTTNTNDVDYKLFVDKGIKTKKVKVTQTAWPDYVFHQQYKLPALAEVEKFIKANNHLPEVPSAKEIETDGLNLGDNQATLLKKIEELTLYIIDLNKKSEEQNKKIAELEKKDSEMKEIKKQLDELKNMILKK
jgi:hypothetical protein